jgi:hypothetical protein
MQSVKPTLYCDKTRPRAESGNIARVYRTALINFEDRYFEGVKDGVIVWSKERQFKEHFR